ncbi:ferrous iron transport protein A [Vibrio sp. SM6]|uniref:Ferrous iron transport protein A n=1 Tax=Vibrio agarilyticus TaxID=2726741 RepID=A0A7X8YG49_9VIBR|nr:FeoA family protein [Vibrio agarilyticus]NLS12007.1 ferrous iron transport protein A [Vibrio agarilyticus]
MKLAALANGKHAIITSMDEVDSATRKKLMVMGILPQSEIEKVRIAPLGDPIQIRVLGVDVAFRKNLAELIEVTPK